MLLLNRPTIPDNIAAVCFIRIFPFLVCNLHFVIFNKNNIFIKKSKVKYFVHITHPYYGFNGLAIIFFILRSVTL